MLGGFLLWSMDGVFMNIEEKKRKHREYMRKWRAERREEYNAYHKEYRNRNKKAIGEAYIRYGEKLINESD